VASLKTRGRTHASSLEKAGAASQKGKAAVARQSAAKGGMTQEGAHRRAAAGRIIAIRLVSLPGHVLYLKSPALRLWS